MLNEVVFEEIVTGIMRDTTDLSEVEVDEEEKGE